MICPNCKTKTKKLICLLNDFKIYQCESCLITFTYPYPLLPDYENIDFHSCTVGSGITNEKLVNLKDLPYDWRRLIKIQSDFIKRNLLAEAKVLELGCGEGILLNEVKNNGFKVTGVEPSITAQARAKSRGLNVIKGTFPDIRFNETFDLVILSQVLEHINDIDRFITEIKKVIPSGYLLLTQTNFKGLIPRFQKSEWYAWVPEQHFWHFTLKGLAKLLLKYNFKLIDYKYSSLVHPHNLLYRISTLKGNWMDQFTALFKLDDQL